ncbi:hypothetical protein HPULCUR_000262 [Helicostylum pulchrum]|uniref:AAA+ ATPase domain-containing protein n=1 Tax=Helicostylum pulchrum TaxID=562976 RepID=A0ABP9XJG6_9FUNG
MKRECPATFFDDEDEDDYLIEASLENNKENDLVSFEDFMSQKPTTVKPAPLTSSNMSNSIDNFGYDFDEFPDFNVEADFEDEELFPTAEPTTVQNTIVHAMDYMDISDPEYEEEETVSLVQMTPSLNLQNHSRPVNQVKEKIEYTLIPETGAFVTATCPQTGKNIYFSKLSEGRLRKKTNLLVKNLTSNKGSKGLLSKPLWQLLKDIKANNLAKTQQIQREINEETSRKHKRQKVIKGESNRLWVDKYRPTCYMDLMGDQRLNRDVLRWVKQWDFCVFKKKPSQETQRDKVMRQYKSTFGTEPKFAAYKTNNSINTDPLLRPEKRIMLMSGPPGFGKTTLAHVIAKQAGYNIIEINASDDRTGAAVKSKIKAALEMQAIIRINAGDNSMSMTQKPNLIIIDEIDGASASGGSDSFIKQLVELVSIEADEKKKGKSKEKPLMRPIICICNDAYSPILRPLRMVAQCVVFNKVPSMSIAKRLQTICELEGLDTDLRALSMLTDLTDGDIRSCLNTLQYIKGKSPVFTKEMIASSGAGTKDMGQSLFSIWKDIFSAPNARYRNSASRADFDTNKYVDRLYSTVMSSGDIDRIMQGCFESYPSMKFHDVALQKFCQMSEWLQFYDTMDKRISAHFEFGLYKYLPYPLINFHRFFAGSTSQEHDVQYPRVQYQVFSTKKSFENLIAIFLTGIHSAKRRYLNKDMVANELVPLLMQIISPDLNITNKQLIKPLEKAKLARLVDIMVEFGLSFKQEKTEDGQYVYKLEPPVEQLLSFELSTPKTILPKQYAVRQMIASEIDTEILRRREEASQSRNGQTKQKDIKQIKPSGRVTEIKTKQVGLDFFGRTVVHKVRLETDKRLKNAKMEGKKWNNIIM